jgi:SAM-dependent methyltransferase
MSAEWPEILFLELADLYLAQLEGLLERAEAEAEGISKLLSAQGIEPPAKILDLCCGIGRHSVALAKRGFQVVGVDFSPKFLAYAQNLAESQGVRDRVEFVLLDARKLRELPHTGFDAVINIFTSFGYYDEETDRSILSQSLELTRPGGVFVLEMLSRDGLIRNFWPAGVMKYPGFLLIEERKFDFATSRNRSVWRFFLQEGEIWREKGPVDLDVRAYALHELIQLFEGAGWKYCVAYGDLQMSPYGLESRRTVLVAKKPGQE